MTTKKDKLEKLDTLLLDRMIDIMEDVDDNKILELSALGVPMNYLKNNQVVSDKPKSSIEEDSQKKLAAAKKRRALGKSK